MSVLLSRKLWDRLLHVPPAVLAAIGIAVGYYASAKLAFLIGTLSDGIFAPFWPPNVILFCGLLLRPRKEWTAILTTTLLAHVLAESSVGMPAEQMLVAFVTNCILAVMNAIAVGRFVKGPPWFGTLQKAAAYIAAAGVINPAIAGLWGAFVPIFGGEPFDNYWIYWANWAAGNALAAIALGPMILGWAEADWTLSMKWGRRQSEATLFVISLLL